MRVAAPLTTVQAAPLLEAGPERSSVQLRQVSRPNLVIDGRDMRVVEAGQRTLPHPALSYSGGGTIETDPQDRTGRATKTPQFIVYVAADGLAAPGERVALRFALPWRPLLGQWVDRLSRMLQGRADI